MTTMKRLALPVLLAIGVALFSCSPAQAQSTITLTNIADTNDPDAAATGEATLTEPFYLSFWWNGVSAYAYEIFGARLTVTCEGLTPGATYRVGPTSVAFSSKPKDQKAAYTYVTASANGTLEVDVPVTYIGCADYWNGYFWQPFECYGYEFSVARKQGKNYVVALKS